MGTRRRGRPGFVGASCAAGAVIVAGLLAGVLHGQAEAAPPATITIVHTNDFHGRYLPFAVAPGNATSQTGDPGDPGDPGDLGTRTQAPQAFAREGRVNGFAHLAAAVADVRAQRGQDRVLLVHAGDTFSDDLLGNLTRGEAMIRLMNALDYDFMALGNHDFDYGWQRTEELQGIATFPMRGANVVVEATGEPFLGDPVRVLDVAGIRVGLLALGYHNTEDTTSPDNVAPLGFGSGIAAARAYLPELRETADVVVVVSHQGTEVDEALARAVAADAGSPGAGGIDVIIGGHSHDLISPPREVGGTWIVQALSHGAAFGILTIELEDGRVSAVAGEAPVLWNDRYKADPTIVRTIEDLERPHRGALDAVIGTAAERIGRQYLSESPFDGFVGDILRRRTGAQIALLPGVGYGISLVPGPVTRQALHALLPHPTRIVTMVLTGHQIGEILEQSATNLRPAEPLDKVGGLVQTSGLAWMLDLSRPAGRRVGAVWVDGTPLRQDRTYSVVTHSGMLAGIHRYDAFAQGHDIRRQDVTVTDAVEEAFRTMGVIRPPRMGRVEILPASTRSRP